VLLRFNAYLPHCWVQGEMVTSVHSQARKKSTLTLTINMQSVINTADLVCQLSSFYFLLTPESTCDRAYYIIQHGTVCKNPAAHILLWGFCLWSGSHVTLYIHHSLYQWHFVLRSSMCWATSRWTSSSAEYARMHRLEQSKQCTTFPKCPDQLGGPHNLLFDEADHWTPFSAELGMVGDIHLLFSTPSWHRQQKFLWCLNSYIPQLRHTVRLGFKSLSWVQGMLQKNWNM